MSRVKSEYMYVLLTHSLTHFKSGNTSPKCSLNPISPKCTLISTVTLHPHYLEFIFQFKSAPHPQLLYFTTCTTPSITRQISHRLSLTNPLTHSLKHAAQPTPTPAPQSVPAVSAEPTPPSPQGQTLPPH